MTYVDNYADTIITQSRQIGQLPNAEQDLYRFVVPPSPFVSSSVPNRDFALDLEKEHFELHLYNRGTTELVKSVAVPFSEGYLYIRQTKDKNILRLGLTLWPGDPLSPEEREETFIEKYLSDVPFGVYDVFINFFADELGTYNEDEWQIGQISDSRRELILERNPTDDQPFDLEEYQQFSYDSIFVRDFDTLIQLLFERGPDEEAYSELIEDFYNRLEGREPELMENIDQSLFIEGLSVLFREIFNEIQRYIEFEEEHNRYRIVRENFDTALREIVFDVVNRGIRQLPEGRNLFLAE